MIEPGQVVRNTYRIERLLGRGGMSDVYLASNIQTGNRVVVRCLREQDDMSQALILRESRVLRQLSHPSIVSVEDTFREDGRVCMVHTYIEGAALDLLKARPLVDLLRIFTDIADGLEYLAARGVVHRDLKPNNILIDAKGRPHLIDFGLAVLTNEPDQLTRQSVVGTPEYMSTEMIRGSTSLEPASDIYALGVMLYVAIVGGSPWDDEQSLHGLLMKKLEGLTDEAVAALRPFEPLGLSELVTALLHTEPSRRPDVSVVRERLHELQRKLHLDPAFRQFAFMQTPLDSTRATVAHVAPSLEVPTMATVDATMATVDAPLETATVVSRPVGSRSVRDLLSPARIDGPSALILLVVLGCAGISVWLLGSGLVRDSSFNAAALSIVLLLTGSTISIVTLRGRSALADTAVIQKRIAAIEAQVSRAEMLSASIVAGIRTLPTEERLKEIVTASIIAALDQVEVETPSRNVAGVIARLGKSFGSEDRSTRTKRIGTYVGTAGGAVTAMIGVVSLLNATGMWSAVRAPTIADVAVVPNRIFPSAQLVLTVRASDPAGLPLSYKYAASTGTLEPHESSAVWTAPAQLDVKMAEFVVTVSNGRKSATEKRAILVNTPPSGDLQGPDAAATKSNVRVRALVSDKDNDTLKYDWNTTCGQIDNTNAPETTLHTQGACSAEITCNISDGFEQKALKKRLRIQP